MDRETRSWLNNWVMKTATVESKTNGNYDEVRICVIYGNDR